MRCPVDGLECGECPDGCVQESDDGLGLALDLFEPTGRVFHCGKEDEDHEREIRRRGGVEDVRDLRGRVT